MKLKYTILPFFDSITATKLFFVVGVLILLYCAVYAAVTRTAKNLHRAPTVVGFAYVGASLCNILMTTMFYWYWALPLCVMFTLVFMFPTASEVKSANTDERVGVWGFNKELCRIRGEIFNDMSIEEQISYRESVKEYRFNRPLFVAVTLLVPVIFVAALYAADIGYLFFPVLLES